MRLTFHAVRLARTERAFDTLKAALTGNGVVTWNDRWTRLYGPPHPTGTEALRHLRHLVSRERDALSAVQAEFDALPESVNRRGAEDVQRKADADRVAAAQAIAAEAGTITI